MQYSRRDSIICTTRLTLDEANILRFDPTTKMLSNCLVLFLLQLGFEKGFRHLCSLVIFFVEKATNVKEMKCPAFCSKKRHEMKGATFII